MFEKKPKHGSGMAWALLIVSLLLILTALGHAYVMLVAAIVGCVIAFAYRGIRQNNLSTTIVSCAAAVAVAVALGFWR